MPLYARTSRRLFSLTLTAMLLVALPINSLAARTTTIFGIKAGGSALEVGRTRTASPSPRLGTPIRPNRPPAIIADHTRSPGMHPEPESRRRTLGW